MLNLFSICTVLVLALSVVSALSVSTSTLSFDMEDSAQTIIVTGNDSLTVDFADTITVIGEDAYQAVFDVTGAKTLTNDTTTITVTPRAGFAADKFELGTLYTTTLSIINASDVTIEVERTTFCEKGCANVGNLRVSDEDFSVKEGFGEDEDFWYPMDEIEVEFNLENKGEDMKDVEIKVCLWDEKDKSCIMDEDDMDISEDDFDLDEDDDQDVILTFTLDLDDMEESTNYVLYVSATGEVDEGTYEGNTTCVSFSQEVEIRTDEAFVIVDDIDFNSESIAAGDTITVTGKAYNIGDEDMDDDEVYVRVYNKELGLDKIVEFNDGIDSFESESFEVSFVVPSNAKNGKYNIDFTVYDDEKIADKYIMETSEDDEAEYTYSIIVQGAASDITASIDAELISEEVKAGSEIKIKATVTNTGSKTATLSLSAVGYSTWAEGAQLSKDVVVLSQGASEEITLTMKAKSDASGSQDFDLKVMSEGKTIATQPVSLEVAQGFSFNLGSDWYLWAIGAFNFILVLAIVIAVVRILRK